MTNINGLMDDVRIYNRALSPDEIKRLYNLAGTFKLNTSINNNQDSLSKGLVGWWTFDGKEMVGNYAFDKSGNGNRRTLTNGPGPTIGKIGQGMQFDGVDDYVTVGNPASLQFGTGNFSISAWFKLDVLNNPISDGEQIVFGYTSGSNVGQTEIAAQNDGSFDF